MYGRTVLPPALTPDLRFPAVPPSTDPPFAFDRLGVRVPAVFVSPCIKAGTVIKTPFDHCSIVATVRKLFCLDKTPFNWREAQAATFDDVLNLPADQVRTERLVLPNPVVSPPLTGAATAKVPPAVRKRDGLDEPRSCASGLSRSAE